MDAYILFTLKPTGELVVEPKGFGGGLCHVATAPYEKNISGVKTLTEEALLPEIEIRTESQEEKVRA